MFKTLLVDDNSTIRKAVRGILSARFPLMQIAEAEDGQEASRLAAALHPDLVFMDIRLPGENGLSLTRKMKAQYPDMDIVFLTNADSQEYQLAARQSGGRFFLIKGNTSVQELLDVVERIMVDRTEEGAASH